MWLLIWAFPADPFSKPSFYLLSGCLFILSAIELGRIVKHVWNGSKEKRPPLDGLRMVVRTRGDWTGYYDWVTAKGQQRLIFAGRSVIHRIESGLKTLKAGSVEQVIVQKLKEGGNIEILLVDPRSSLLASLAQKEHQTVAEMGRDIYDSLEACKRIFSLLLPEVRSQQDKYEWKYEPSAKLLVGLYDESLPWAFHREDNKRIVGFYPAGIRGSSSPAYEVIGPCTKEFFDDYFSQLVERSSTLLDFSARKGHLTFDQQLFDELCNALVKVSLRKSNANERN